MLQKGNVRNYRVPITAEKLSVAKETLLSMKITQVNFTVAFCMNSIRHMFRYFYACISLT